MATAEDGLTKAGKLLEMMVYVQGLRKRLTIVDTAPISALRKAILAAFKLNTAASDLIVRSPDEACEPLGLEGIIADALQYDRWAVDVYVELLPKKIVNQKSIEALLLDKNIEVDEGLLRRMQLRFPAAVSLAVTQQNVMLAMDAYSSAVRLPDDATIKDLRRLEIVLCNLVPDSPRISGCLKQAIPSVLKILTNQEQERQAAALAGGVEFLPVHHLVPFEIVEVKEGTRPCIVMPLYAVTVGTSPTSPNYPVWKLFAAMKLALTHLHSKGFAHCNVTPDNIFIQHDGAFVLGDYGSIARFGCWSRSTRSHVPIEALEAHSDRQRASAALDWWMLAITLLQKRGTATLAEGWGRDRVKREVRNIEGLQELSALLE